MDSTRDSRRDAVRAEGPMAGRERRHARRREAYSAALWIEHSSARQPHPPRRKRWAPKGVWGFQEETYRQARRALA
jgi:hypothetical protein